MIGNGTLRIATRQLTVTQDYLTGVPVQCLVIFINNFVPGMSSISNTKIIIADSGTDFNLSLITSKINSTLVNTVIHRVIDQTSSGINNRQSVCREKKDFPVSDCMFQELFMSL